MRYLLLIFITVFSCTNNSLKKTSISSINNISQEIASNIIEKVAGDKLNESSIKAVVEDVAKKNIGKYL